MDQEEVEEVSAVAMEEEEEGEVVAAVAAMAPTHHHPGTQQAGGWISTWGLPTTALCWGTARLPSPASGTPATPPAALRGGTGHQPCSPAGSTMPARETPDDRTGTGRLSLHRDHHRWHRWHRCHIHAATHRTDRTITLALVTGHTNTNTRQSTGVTWGMGTSYMAVEVVVAVVRDLRSRAGSVCVTST